MDRYEVDPRLLTSYQKKQPLDWKQDPPVWPLTEVEWNAFNDGATLNNHDGKQFVKGVDNPDQIVKVALPPDGTEYVSVGIACHVFYGDEKYVPEGVTFPTAS